MLDFCVKHTKKMLDFVLSILLYVRFHVKYVIKCPYQKFLKYISCTAEFIVRIN